MSTIGDPQENEFSGRVGGKEASFAHIDAPQTEQIPVTDAVIPGFGPLSNIVTQTGEVVVLSHTLGAD